MRKIIVLFACICAIFAGPVLAEDSTEWKKWNASPFAKTYVEACQKAPDAVRGFSLPQKVTEHFISELTSFCEGSKKEVWLVPNMRLEQMWSGATKSRPAHLMNQVSVGELPVSKSPDGRPYRKNAVAETARAYAWSFEYEGKTYTLYLPFVCFNWSWAYEEKPQASAKEACVEIVFSVPPTAHVRWGVATTNGPLPPSECNAQKEGDGRWEAWHGMCAECTAANISFISQFLVGGVEVPHKYLYPVRESKQILRFSRSVMNAVVYICLTDRGVADSKTYDLQTCGVYVRPEDWKSDRVEIPRSFWIWDTAKCPT